MKKILFTTLLISIALITGCTNKTLTVTETATEKEESSEVETKIATKEVEELTTAESPKEIKEIYIEETEISSEEMEIPAVLVPNNNTKDNEIIEDTPTDEIFIDDTPDEILPSNILNVSCILQNPELPTGCEITSLTTVLNYYGYNIDKCTLSDNYLDKGVIGETNPYNAFIGSPRDNNSFGCYAPVIVNCANKFLNGARSVENVTGAPLESLFDEIDNGHPIIIWATSYMANSYYSVTWNLPDGDFTWRSKEHCLVLTGYDYNDRVVYVSDPLVGNTSYDMDVFENRYNQLYSQAVIIR